MGQANRIHRIVEHKKSGGKNGKHLDQMNKESNPSVYPTFSLEIQHCSERLRVTCTVGLLTCLNWQTHR